MKSFINNIAALACLVLALNVTSTHLRSCELRHEKTDFLHICEKKMQISCTVTSMPLFCYIDNAIPLLPKSKAIFCDCTAWFVSDLVGIPEDRFSHDAAQA